MFRPSRLTAILASLAVLGLSLPPGLAIGETPFVSDGEIATPQAGDENQPLDRDVALAADGMLTGQVVDASGRPRSGVIVELRQAGGELVETVSDRQGRFVVSNLRGGVYEMRTQETQTACRLWAPGTAPPAATAGVLIVEGTQTARGQFARDRYPYGTVQPSRRAIILGSLIGAGIFVPLYTGRDRNPGS